MAALHEHSTRDTPISTFTLPKSAIADRIIWPSSHQFVTHSADNTVRIWDFTNGAVTQVGAPMVHNSPIMGIVTTKDGQIISCTREDEHLVVWNAASQEIVNGSWLNENYGRAHWIDLSPNEELLVSCHEEWIVFWEMTGTMRVKSYIDVESIGWPKPEAGTRRACFSPDGRRLALYFGRKFIILNVESGEPIFGPHELTFEGFDGLSTPLLWSPDGARLLYGCGKGSIWCLDSRTGEANGEPWTGHQESVRCLSISFDGKWLASGSLDRTILIWEVGSDDLVGEGLRHDAPVGAIAFSPCGEFMACGTWDRQVAVWRVPWWEDDDQKVPNPLLDLSAVIHDGPSDIPREPDLSFLDMSAPRRPLPPQDRVRERSSDGLPRVHNTPRSRSWWKRIPRFVFVRADPVYMGWAPPRTFVASRETVDSSPRSLPQPIPLDSEQHPTVTVTAESSSGDYSDESSTDTPPDDLEASQVGCCGLLSRRRTTRVTPPATTTRPLDTSVPAPTPPRHTPRDILDLPAIIETS